MLYLHMSIKDRVSKRKKKRFPDLPPGRLLGHLADRKQFFTKGWPDQPLVPPFVRVIQTWKPNTTSPDGRCQNSPVKAAEVGG